MIGLDYNAVFKLAEIYGIELTPGEFSKLRVLEACQLERVRKEAKNQNGD